MLYSKHAINGFGLHINITTKVTLMYYLVYHIFLKKQTSKCFQSHLLIKKKKGLSDPWGRIICLDTKT